MQAIINSHSGEQNVISQLALTWRTMFAQLSITYGKDQLSAAKKLADTLIKAFGEQSYSVSQSDADLQDSVDETRHPGLKTLNQRVKKALDPQHNFG